jgi:hypothetical protein
LQRVPRSSALSKVCKFIYSISSCVETIQPFQDTLLKSLVDYVAAIEAVGDDEMTPVLGINDILVAPPKMKIA